MTQIMDFRNSGLSLNGQGNGPSCDQQVYDHLLEMVSVLTPEEMIEHFQRLFIIGSGLADPNSHRLVDRLISSKGIENDFDHTLNRCCYILINRWLTRSQAQGYIPQLIALFDSIPERPVMDHGRSRMIRRLRDLVTQFTKSEQCAKLRLLAQMSLGHDVGLNDTRPLSTLIRRYPYLYQHCLMSDSSGEEQKYTISCIQKQAQKQFEFDLSRYVTYQVRRYRLAQSADPMIANRIIRPVANPTLLNDNELYRALRQFSGKVERGLTYKDMAQQLINHAGHSMSYGSFKGTLYEYLTTTIDPGYGKRGFNNQLFNHMSSILPDQHSQPLNDFLVVRTCSKVLDFLVIESPQNAKHYVFLDLVNNVGPTMTTALVIKVVLFCNKVKPYLERRFSILFNHYQAATRQTMQFLIKTLENLNIAFSINFGSFDPSLLR